MSVWEAQPGPGAGRPQGARHRLLTAVLLAGALVASTPSASSTGPPAPPASAELLQVATSERVVAPVPAVVGVVAVAVRPRTIAARPGFRRTPTGSVLDVARFTTVGTFTLPASASSRTVVLSTQVTVSVPTRLALSVLAWCRPPGSDSATPEAPSLRDVLVIGQNPVPGRTSAQVASRTLSGRAIVDVPAGTTVGCVLQLSPRTETLGSSSMRLISGRFAAAPVTVPARAAQRPALLVGQPGSPGSAGRAIPERRVAVIRPTAIAPGRIRVEGEAELTTCAYGYQLCARGTSAPASVELRLELAEVGVGGRVCAQAHGALRRVTITPGVHHVKVIAPALAHTVGCGGAVTAWLLVRHRGGNAVEVEPTLAATRVQTHVWLESSTS
jgi:hypothetical protein